jgi:hypothetical protein
MFLQNWDAPTTTFHFSTPNDISVHQVATHNPFIQANTRVLNALRHLSSLRVPTKKSFSASWLFLTPYDISAHCAAVIETPTATEF